MATRVSPVFYSLVYIVVSISCEARQPCTSTHSGSMFQLTDLLAIAHQKCFVLVKVTQNLSVPQKTLQKSKTSVFSTGSEMLGG